MTRAAPLALAAALCACGVHFVGAPARRDPPARSALAAASPRVERLDAEFVPAPLREKLRPEEILRERLAARGVSTPAAGASPEGAATVTAVLLGRRTTALTRWTAAPMALAFLGTLGLLPHRAAFEHFVEVQVDAPGAPAGHRFRAARRSYVTVHWLWLPLAVLGPSAPPDPELAVQREGLARALDDALDEVLAPGR